MRQSLFDRMNNLQRDIKRWTRRRVGRPEYLDVLEPLKERVDSLLEVIKRELCVAALEHNLELARNPANRLWVDDKMKPHLEGDTEVTE